MTTAPKQLLSFYHLGSVARKGLKKGETAAYVAVATKKGPKGLPPIRIGVRKGDPTRNITIGGKDYPSLAVAHDTMLRERPTQFPEISCGVLVLWDWASGDSIDGVEAREDAVLAMRSMGRFEAANVPLAIEPQADGDAGEGSELMPRDLLEALFGPGGLGGDLDDEG